MVLRANSLRLLVLAGLLTLQFLVPALAPGTPPVALGGAGTVGGFSSVAPAAEQPEPEQAVCDSPDPVSPNGLPRTRDRYRAPADLAPQPAARPPSTRAPLAECPHTAVLAAARPPHLGASAADSAAVLQVFRR
ncbi:hypothetical protein [Amycolatopsis albispora]|uniref:Uncharacterized protein n=1 Tax=Amycolatopsis albispora TaxID=1804986 RepID=A0A344KZZ1_9PSEU|nr:hypothetical protein [Amycolatopsis albispora]AXB41365.1 hypothetical protein A4R43_01540 [Amycolatopsis albispora]